MSFEPLCFLHVTNVFLDRQLDEIDPIPADLRPAIEDVALTVFERIVTLAIKHDVDFVLLVGNTFDVTDHSIRARAALLTGLHRLADRGIPVFALPGEADPLEAWREIPGLPANLTLLGTQSPPPVPVHRDGRLIATIQGPGQTNKRSCGMTDPARPSPDADADETEDWGPITLKLLIGSAEALHRPHEEPGGPSSIGDGALRVGNRLERLRPLSDSTGSDVDYVALGGGQHENASRSVRGGSRRQTVTTARGLAHHPGSPQGLNPRQSGPHGCSLVEVDAEGQVHCTLLPTAAVRWERFSMSVPHDVPWEELTSTMRAHIAGRQPEEGEHVWLVQWTLTGHGPLFDALVEEERQRHIAESLDEHSPPERPRCVHSFRLIPQPQCGNEALPTQSASSQEGDTADFAAEYQDRLETRVPLSVETITACLQEVMQADETTARRIDSLIAELDRDVVIRYAHRLGATWFGPAPPGGPPP